MVLKKLSNILLFLALLFPAVAVAGNDEVEDRQEKGRFSILDEGEPAPFPGVIYDALGNAVILSEPQRLKEEKELELNELREIMKADFQKEYDLLEAKRQSQETKYKGIIAAKDDEIKKLQKEASNEGLPGAAWFGLGVGGGAAAALLVVALIAL